MGTLRGITAAGYLLILILGLTQTGKLSPATEVLVTDEKGVARSVTHTERSIGVLEIGAVLRKRLHRESAAQALQLARHIVRLCRYYKFDPAEVLALIQAESSFNSHAISRVGAVGLMQLMPRTATYIARLSGVRYSGRAELFNPFVNISLGMAYLSYLRKRFDSSTHYLAAYNLGPTTVGKMVRANRFRLGKVRKYVYGIQDGIHSFRREIMNHGLRRNKS